LSVTVIDSLRISPNKQRWSLGSNHIILLPQHGSRTACITPSLFLCECGADQCRLLLMLRPHPSVMPCVLVGLLANGLVLRLMPDKCSFRRRPKVCVSVSHD